MTSKIVVLSAFQKRFVWDRHQDRMACTPAFRKCKVGRRRSHFHSHTPRVVLLAGSVGGQGTCDIAASGVQIDLASMSIPQAE